MRGSVGKPTLSVVKLHSAAKFIHINNLIWIHVRDDPGKSVFVPGTDHGCDPFFSLEPVWRSRCERPKAPPLGEAQCSGHGLAVRMLVRRPAIVFTDPRRPKLFRKSTLPIAPAAQRARSPERVRSIVDVTEFGEAIDQGFQVRFPLPVPPALPELARKVGTKLCPGGRIFADIAKRELLKGRLLERRQRAPGLGECHIALFVPHCLAKGKRLLARHIANANNQGMSECSSATSR